MRDKWGPRRPRPPSKALGVSCDPQALEFVELAIQARQADAEALGGEAPVVVRLLQRARDEPRLEGAQLLAQRAFAAGYGVGTQRRRHDAGDIGRKVGERDALAVGEDAGPVQD